MITKLNIKNFQSHKRSELNFHKGVNVIVGETDCGKTSILRSLRWDIQNKPSGDGFRSNWGGDTEVALTTSEGAEVRRVKTNSTNLYFLNETRFAAFGQDVPEEIQKALNFSETNLQAQFDQPFLLNSNPGEVANHFSHIANIEDIGICLKKLQGKITKLTTEKQQLSDNKQRLLEKLEGFQNLEKIEIELEVLEDLENRERSAIQKASSLKSLVSQIEIAEKQLKEVGLNTVLGWINVLADFQAKKEKRHEIYRKTTDLRTLLEDLERAENKIENFQKFADLSPLLEEVVKTKTAAEKERKEVTQLFNLILPLNQAILDSKVQEKELTTLKDELSLKMPEICPLCGK